MFRKTRNRILLLNMVMVSSVVIVAFSVIFITIYTRVQNDNLEKLMTAMPPHIVISSDESFRHGSGIRFEQDEAGTFVTGFSGRISPDAGLSFSLTLDPDFNVVEVNSMVDLREESYNIMAARAIETAGRHETISIEGRTWQYMATPIMTIHREAAGESAEFAEISAGFTHIRYLDITDSQRTIQSLAITLSGATLAILAVFFFISRFFADRAIKPMEEAWEKQNRFITDASHELKTPLSVISANCGVLYADKEETVENQLKWVDSIMRAGDRMTGLVGSMLSLAGMEDSQLELLCSPFDLSAEVTAAICDMEAAALEKNLVLTKEIAPEVTVESDREHVRRILSVLLDNAVKYTDIGGEVTVLLKKEKRRALLSVRNSGDGIQPEHLPRLFDRFYRADPSRSSENGGYGLGLAIAKAIANQLGAELSVESAPGEFTEFRLLL